jgi:hypothetical protein
MDGPVMPLPPKPVSATIRYDDGTWVVVRPSDIPGKYTYRYWGDPDDDGDTDLIAMNDHNSGIWAAMMAVVAMAQISRKGDE